MRLPLLLAFSWLLVAAAPIMSGSLQNCPTAAGTTGCTEVDEFDLRLGDGETFLRQQVAVDPARIDGRPLMVTLIALASAELRWNGALIGRNGVPGPDRASEVPGLYVSAFMIPAAAVRPAVNVLTIRLTAQHLWLPVRSPVHYIGVGFYETPRLPGVQQYLPALLTLGALLAGLFYFGATALADRRDKGALALALLSATATAQLLVEVSRAFIAYTYPWHLARVSLIALLAALTATLLAYYAARRFAPGWVRAAVAVTALLSAASLIFIPWFDIKAMGALGAGFSMAGLCAARGWRTGQRVAPIALVVTAVGLGLIASDGTGYLDRSHYLLLAALIIGLISEQVIALRRARAERDVQARLAAALAARLRAAEEAGEPILALRDGGRVHRVAESDVIAVRAADDYCDVALADGRTLLVTMTLARLLEALPARFLRVHKSHAVNRAHVTGTAPRAGGGTMLTMSDGGEIPVGRSFATAVTAWLSLGVADPRT